MTRTVPLKGKSSRQFTFRCPSGRHQYIATVPYRMKSRAAPVRILLLDVLFHGVLFGHKPEQAATSNTSLAGHITNAVLVERAPRLDGTLDAPDWQQPVP